MLFLQQFPGVSGLGVDLPFLFAALVGLRRPPAQAAAWGFLCGSLQDLLSAGWWGPNAVAKTGVALMSSLAQRHVYRERVWTQSAWVLFGSTLHQLFLWWVLDWKGSAPPAEDALGIAARNVVFTTLAAVPICIVLVRFRRRRMDPATA
jgi:rod shape-determining protein MreD